MSKEPKFIHLVTTPLDGWLEPETDDELHDRIFNMAKISAKAFGWEVGDENFISTYQKFVAVSEEARKYHEHLVLLALLTLKDLMEDGGLSFETSFSDLNEVEEAMRKTVRRLVNVLEHVSFTSSPFRNLETLKEMPKELTEIKFTFIAEPASHSDASSSDSEEELYNFFENLDAPDYEDFDRFIEEWYNSREESSDE